MTNEELYRRALHSAFESHHELLIAQDKDANYHIAKAYHECQAAMVCLQELKNRSEGVEPPKQG